MHILLVEDDELLGDGIRVGLGQYGYTVTWLKDGQTAMQSLKVEKFDLIVLDLGLPRVSGIAVLKFLRSKNINTPVLILTACDAIEDRIAGLDAGADDYMTKPFDLDELCARIRALLRRAHGRAESILTYGDLSIDPASHIIFYKDELMNISRREFVLLQKFIENQGKVITRNQLTQTLYGWGDEIDSNALEVHIHNIRKKFGADLIRTVRGVGYMMEKESKP
jgi:two-component system, OmpR family, response regulator QseB